MRTETAKARLPPSRPSTDERSSTDEVLGRLRSFETAEVAVGQLSVTVQEGDLFYASSLRVISDGVEIGSVALGHLFLSDERHRAAVLDGLAKLGIPVAAPREPQPEAAASTEWAPDEIPNASVAYGPGGHAFLWVEPNLPRNLRRFARYNTTTKILWVEDRRLVAPACIVAARVGLEIAEVLLPPESWTLAEWVKTRELEDFSYRCYPPFKARELHPRVTELIPEHLFDQHDLTRFAQIETCGYQQQEFKRGREPTEPLERLTPHRLALFPGHTFLNDIGTCRICDRPAGQFRTPICAETLAYCHRCLAAANKGLSSNNLKHATARGILAVRALADHEFGGAAFVEAQLATVHGDPARPVDARDIDRSMLLRIAITRRQLPWTHVLIDAGLAEDGVRLSRGTALKAIDGHRCSSMLEKVIDDFLHQHGIDHTREPLYPFDENHNPNTRLRADWLLSDGTFVEMWGMPDDPGYADKMRKKIELAARHKLRLVGITPVETGNLSTIFADWTTT